MSGVDNEVPDPAEVALGRLIADGMTPGASGQAERRVMGLLGAAADVERPRPRRRWIPVTAGALGALAAAVLLVVLAAPTGTAATIVSLAARAAGEPLDRRYEVTIERRGLRFEPGQFRLDLRGDNMMRFEGLAGPFEGIILGRDGETYFAVPPRPRAPVFVTDSAEEFEDWMRGRQLSRGTLDVGLILDQLVGSDAGYEIRTGRSPAPGVARVIAERSGDGPSPAPDEVELDVRTSDGVLLAMELRFGLPRPPRAPLWVRFELDSEEARPEGWYSLDSIAGPDRRRAPMTPR